MNYHRVLFLFFEFLLLCPVSELTLVSSLQKVKNNMLFLPGSKPFPWRGVKNSTEYDTQECYNHLGVLNSTYALSSLAPKAFLSG